MKKKPALFFAGSAVQCSPVQSSFRSCSASNAALRTPYPAQNGRAKRHKVAVKAVNLSDNKIQPSTQHSPVLEGGVALIGTIGTRNIVGTIDLTSSRDLGERKCPEVFRCFGFFHRGTWLI